MWEINPKVSNKTEVRKLIMEKKLNSMVSVTTQVTHVNTGAMRRLHTCFRRCGSAVRVVIFPDYTPR